MKIDHFDKFFINLLDMQPNLMKKNLNFFLILYQLTANTCNQYT